MNVKQNLNHIPHHWQNISPCSFILLLLILQKTSNCLCFNNFFKESQKLNSNANVTILATAANTVIRRRGPFCPRLRMRRMNTLVTSSTNSFWLPQTLYTDVRKIPDFTKKAQVSWMCFIILNNLNMAHHNSLGISQLKIRHLYGTFNFSTQCICMGTGSLFVYRFSSFSWKGAPSTKENGICGSVNSSALQVRIELHSWTWTAILDYCCYLYIHLASKRYLILRWEP